MAKDEHGHQNPEAADADFELPDIETPEVLSHEVRDDFGYDVAFKMAFVGIGQGGGRIAETFYKLGYRRVAVINSAMEDLKDLDEGIEKMDMGTGGAGQDMALGRQFIEHREQEVFDVLQRGVGEQVDFLLICVSFGGGTGGGGAATLVKICRKYMDEIGADPQRVGIIGSLPCGYEGQRACRNAVTAFHEVSHLQPSPFIIIDNKRIEKLYKRGANEFFAVCNNQVAKLFHLFNRLATQRSMITFDRADYATLLDSGIIAFGASPIKKYQNKADISEAMGKSLADTVLAEVDLKRGKCAGCIFLGGKAIMQSVPMDYFGNGFQMLNRMLADGGVVYRGVYEGNSDDLRCYTMISALPPPAVRLQELAKEGRLPAQPSSTMARHLGVDDGAT